MNRGRIRVALTATLAGLLLTACGADGSGQGAPVSETSGSDFPSKNIRLIVPYPAGGSTDLLARTFAPSFQEQFHQNVIVENLSGASGTQAVNELMDSAPDGHTVVWGTAGPLAITPTLGHVGYSIKDYGLAGIATINPYVLVSRTGSEFTTAKELFSAAKEKPGSVTIATPGPTTIQSILLKAMADEAGVKLTLVPFGGGANTLNAALGGNVDASFNVLSEVTAQIKAGAATGLGITTDKRSPFLPDVPTLREQGIVPPVEGGPTALMLPAGTPDEIVDRWAAALKEATANKKVLAQLERFGAVPSFIAPDEARDVIAKLAEAAAARVSK